MRMLLDMISEHASQNPSRTAVCHRLLDGRYIETSYAELARKARRFASALAEETPAGALVPLLMGKSADLVAAMVGALSAGRVFTCLNPKLRAPQVAAILEAAGASLALIDGMGLQALKGGLLEGPILRTRWWLVRSAGFAAMHERLADQIRASATVDEWQALSERSAEHGPAPLVDDARRPGCCLFTSGSTGVPKGVVVAEAELWARGAAEAELLGLDTRDVLLSVLPFSFVVGLNQVIAGLTAGCELVLLESWLPRDILKAAAERKVTGITAVPAIWQDFLHTGLRFDKRGAHAAMRYVTISGGDLSRPQLERLPAVFEGIGIYKTYGSTEAFRSTALLPGQFAEKRCSVGREAPGTRVYVVREDGTQAKPMETGEIVVTGLGLMLGYLDGKDPQNKMRPNPFRGSNDDCLVAVYSGDQGYKDEEGFVFVQGRRDEMLKIQGNRVYPAEIQAQILAIRGVSAAEVIGVKTEDGQTHLAAFLMVSSEVPSDAEALRRELLLRVPSYMVPEHLIVLASLPRTSSGKPDRPALAREARELFMPQRCRTARQPSGEGLTT